MATPVLMFMNMKGGVGKTTLAIEMARTMAVNYDKDVLLIDYDPQANASFALLGAATYFGHLSNGRSLARCLMPEVKPNDPFSVIGSASSPPASVSSYVVQVRRWYYNHDNAKKAGRVDLIPGSLELMRLAINRLDESAEKRLMERWSTLVHDAKQNYDLIVIDCHPAGSFFTKSALLKANAVIIPVTTDNFSATGLGLMRSFIDEWSVSGGAAEYVVIFNNAYRSWDGTIEAAIRGDPKFSDHCLTHNVGYSSLFHNMARRRKTVAEQLVSHRHLVGNMIEGVVQETVEYLKGRNVFDSSWS